MPSPVLDLYTLSIILILISAALSVAMLVAWRANKTYDGFGWWTAGNLVGSSGFVFIIFRGMLPDMFTVIAGNMMSIIGLLLALHGIRLFLGRKGRVYFNAGIVTIYLTTAVYYVGVENSLVMRIVCGSTLVATITAAAAYEFVTIQKHAQRFVHRFAAALFFGFSILLFARGVLTLAFAPISDLFVPNWIQSNGLRGVQPVCRDVDIHLHGA